MLAGVSQEDQETRSRGGGLGPRQQLGLHTGRCVSVTSNDPLYAAVASYYSFVPPL